jgi:HD superfamily phosphohydrolase
MKLRDPVYGVECIDDPALVAVLGSAPMQRLRGVLQHGITALIGVTAPVTRYDHSVGAMILIRRLGGSREAQLAALLHDISHTAFSHVIDYVFDDHEGQSYHEEMKPSYVADTNLPALLAAHGFDWRVIIQEERYPMLEQPAPALCADRLDYSLRDGLDLGLLRPADVAEVLAHLTVAQDGSIVMTDRRIARLLADAYLAADEASWANFREVGLYELTARAIRRALGLGVLVNADIWGTDQAAWRKLQASSDSELRDLVRLVNRETRFVWDAEAPTFLVSTKLRTLDPAVAQDGQIRTLSELDPAFAQRRHAYLARKAGPWPMRVVPHDS